MVCNHCLRTVSFVRHKESGKVILRHGATINLLKAGLDVVVPNDRQARTLPAMLEKTCRINPAIPAEDMGE